MLMPMGSRVMVESAEQETTTATGLVLPTSAQQVQNKGKVIAVGSKVTEAIGVGDEVLYAQYGGVEITVDDKKLLLFREEDILAVWRTSS